MPQLSLFEPVLFEPGGRVWFLIRTSDSPPEGEAAGLIGFDGKTFIEHLPSPHTRFLCDWGGAGRLGPATALFVDGKAFFAASNSVHIYDGHDWIIHEFPSFHSTFSQAGFNLYPEPDGKGVLAISTLQPAQPVWRYRDGNWTHHATGVIDDEASRQDPSYRLSHPQPRRTEIPATPSVAPRQHGVWILPRYDGPIYVPFDTTEVSLDPPISVTDLIHELAVPETRDNAATELLARGRLADPEIRKAIAATEDAESRARLEKILAALPMNSMVHEAWRMGPYNVSSIDLILPLPNGATIFRVRRVLDSSGKRVITIPADAQESPVNLHLDGPAILIQAPDGKVHLLEGVPLLQWSGYISASPWERTIIPGLLAVEGNSRIWTLAGSSQNGPELLDIATGHILQHIPLPGATSVAAVANDGTLFVTVDKMMAQTPENQILAYRPAGKDTRRVVQPIEKAVSARSAALTADGSYWFLQHPQNSQTDLIAARYNGKSIDQYPASRIHTDKLFESTNFTSGRDGILIQTAKSWTLVTPRGAHQSDDLEDLIAKNPTEFAATFQGPLSVPSGYEPKQIIADSAGNIWLLRPSQGALKVFANGAWLDAADALRKAGSPRGSAIAILPVGQSTKILAADRFPNVAAGAAWPQTTFLLSIVGNEIVAQPQPIMFEFLIYNRTMFYSPGGEPWVKIRHPDSGPPFYGALCRMTPQGPADIVDRASLLFTNSTGDVWMKMDPGADEPGSVRVRTNGKLIPAPTLPFSVESGNLWPAPNGRVCQASLLGLNIVKINERAGILTASDAETLSFAPIETRPNVLAISPLGFVAVSSGAPENPAQPPPNLFFYPLEKP